MRPAFSRQRFVSLQAEHGCPQSSQLGGSAPCRSRTVRGKGVFLVSFAMDDHHILIFSILVGMAAAGIVFGTFLVHALG